MDVYNPSYDIKRVWLYCNEYGEPIHAKVRYLVTSTGYSRFEWIHGYFEVQEFLEQYCCFTNSSTKMLEEQGIIFRKSKQAYDMEYELELNKRMEKYRQTHGPYRDIEVEEVTRKIVKGLKLVAGAGILTFLLVNGYHLVFPKQFSKIVTYSNPDNKIEQSYDRAVVNDF